MIKRSRPIDTYLQKIYKVERVSTFSDKKLNKDKRFFKKMFLIFILNK